jgi:hypothetical protein
MQAMCQCGQLVLQLLRVGAVDAWLGADAG